MEQHESKPPTNLDNLGAQVDSAINYIKIELSGVILLLAILGFKKFKNWLTDLNEHPGWRLHTTTLLNELMHESRSDRAVVALFHNGEYFTNRAATKRFSITFEVKREGLASVRKLVSNVPIEAVDQEIKKCQENPKGLIIIRSDTNTPIGCTSHLAAMGAKAAIYWYFQHQNTPIAFLGLFYNSVVPREALELFLRSQQCSELINRIRLTIIRRKIH